MSVFVWSEYNLHQNTGCVKVKELLSKESIIRVLGLERLVQMYKSMKSSWIKMSILSVWWKKDGKWGKEIQQSLTDKAQCTPSINSLCSDKVRVKKGKEI